MLTRCLSPGIYPLAQQSHAPSHFPILSIHYQGTTSNPSVRAVPTTPFATLSSPKTPSASSVHFIRAISYTCLSVTVPTLGPDGFPLP